MSEEQSQIIASTDCRVAAGPKTFPTTRARGAWLAEKKTRASTKALQATILNVGCKNCGGATIDKAPAK
jgi:hypothetical protein